jgi:hypothetical protein
MAKVYGMHMIALKPGVKAEEFEKFVVEEVYSLPMFEGQEGYLLKGDRGDREDKYLWLMEIESVENRDRYYPSPGKTAEEADQFVESHPEFVEMVKKWETFATPIDVIYTDYVVVGK